VKSRNLDVFLYGGFCVCVLNVPYINVLLLSYFLLIKLKTMYLCEKQFMKL